MNSVVLHLYLPILIYLYINNSDSESFGFLKITWLHVEPEGHVFSNLFIFSLSFMKVNKIANNTNSLDK